MAELIENTETPGNAANLDELQHFEQANAQPAAEELPEKYRGKTPAEIAKMHMEAEKTIGRQAQEVGEVRRLADELIRAKFQQPQPPVSTPAPTVDDADFLLNPKEAVTKLVATHPAVLQAQAQTAMLQRMENKRALLSQHPDAEQLVQDPEFLEWVNKSQVRQRMLNHAHRNFDAEAGAELFSTFKEVRAARQNVVKEGAAAVRAEADKALKNAGVVTGGSAAEGGKKVFRRADLISLQLRDPKRYMDLQDEIMQAYSEGRVR